MRNLDQLKRRLVQGSLRRLVTRPVRVCLLDDNLTLIKQAFEREKDIKVTIPRLLRADGDVDSANAIGILG